VGKLGISDPYINAEEPVVYPKGELFMSLNQPARLDVGAIDEQLFAAGQTSISINGKRP
jgi:hypothetical protein